MFVFLCTKIMSYAKKALLMFFAMLCGVALLSAAAENKPVNKQASFTATMISAIMGTVEGMSIIKDEELLLSARMRLVKLTEKLKYNEGKEGMLSLKMALTKRCSEENCQEFEKMLYWVDNEYGFLETVRAGIVAKLLMQQEIFTTKVTIPSDILILQKNGWTRKQMIKESWRAILEARELKKTALRQAASTRLIGYTGQAQENDARANVVLVPFLAKKLLFPRAKSPLGQVSL